MLVKRSGANRNSGYTVIIRDREFASSWKKTASVATLTVTHVSDPNANGEYNYQFNFSVTELGLILELLSQQALQSSPEIVAEALAPHSRALLRLLIAAAGMQSPDLVKSES